MPSPGLYGGGAVRGGRRVSGEGSLVVGGRKGSCIQGLTSGRPLKLSCPFYIQPVASCSLDIASFQDSML